MIATVLPTPSSRLLTALLVVPPVVPPLATLRRFTRAKRTILTKCLTTRFPFFRFYDARMAQQFFFHVLFYDLMGYQIFFLRMIA